jgi:hypothetical protein
LLIEQVGSISAPFGEPASRFTSAIERSGIWKKVKITLAQFGATERVHHVYKNACATLGNTFVSAGWDQFQLLLVNQPVVLLVQLNVRNMEEGKIATAWAQFDATEKVHPCI